MKGKYGLMAAGLMAALAFSARAATLSGTITYTGDQTGQVYVATAQTLPGNKALKLDGDADFVRIPTLMDLSGSELTIQYWFKGSTVQSAVRQQSSGYLVAGWNGQHIISTDGGTTGLSAGAGLTDGNWHHVIMTWKQNTPGGFASYLDGQLVTSRTSADTPIPNLEAEVYFGAFNGQGEYMSGLLDEVAIWNRALPATEITAKWNKRLAGNETGLVGYWKFDNDTADDASPNGHHGEMNGDAVIEAADIPGLDGGLGRVVLEGPGTYTIADLPTGAGYVVNAFRDVNGNGGRDPSEPYGQFAGNPFTLSGDQSDAHITLIESPRITQQPLPVRVGVGGTATFTVAAKGTEPFTYEWRKDDVPLNDTGRFSGTKTAELKLTSAQLADTGVYTVFLSNAAGNTLSEAASLTVIAGGVSISGNLAYSGSATGKVYITAAQRRTGNKALQVKGAGTAATTLLNLSGEELTIQYWFKGTSIQSAVRQQSGAGYIVAGWNGLHIVSNDRGTSGLSAGENVTDGSWHHLAMSWKLNTPDGFATYLDGRLVAKRDSTDTPIPNLDAQVYFGSWNNAGEFGNGMLDEIAIWQKALSASEIAAIWRSSLTGNEAGLLGYWNFDDGVGGDLSPNANHAELLGDAAILDVDIPQLGKVFTEVLNQTGAYTVPFIPTGNGYYVTAFMDQNGNAKQDEGEPMGAYAGNPFNLTGNKTGVDFELMDPPFITVQPAAQRIAPGGNATFTVTVTGSTPMSFQWQKNGAPLTDVGNLSGARTATLTITGAQLADEGRFGVVITNAVGSATSLTVPLIVVSGISDRLIGYWKLDETTGTTANDASGKGLHGALGNYVGDDSQWVAGIIGGALQFGGPETTEHVLVPDYPKPTSTVSFSGWVWAVSRPTWASVIKNWGGSQVGQFHFGLTDTAGDLSNYLTTGGNASMSTRENVLFPTNSWQHVAFVADGGRMRIYRNGMELSSVAYDGTLLATPIPSLGIGVKTSNAGDVPDSGSPGYWHGLMDDLGLWERVLAPEEVYAIYQAGQAGKPLTDAVIQPPSPTLKIALTGSSVVLSWPTSATGFELQVTERLAPANWTAETAPVVPAGDQSTVTIPVAPGAKFYRLRHP